VIFQRRIEAVADLRITVIGDDIFAASAAVDSLEYDVDVRMNLNVKYSPHTLPESVASLLKSLMRTLRLDYGAIDMRLTNDGRYVFLEINPAGEFLYIEEATGQPIAAALAARLASVDITLAAKS
jgi:glutathione synthase/RimK-type ligase-like ATP-grasp enzyme